MKLVVLYILVVPVVVLGFTGDLGGDGHSARPRSSTPARTA